MQILIRRSVFAVILTALIVISGIFFAPADAHCPHNGDSTHKHCSSSNGGGGEESKPKYAVSLIGGGFNCAAPLFNPGELNPPIFATTVDVKGPSVSYSANFPRHLSEGGPTLTMDSGLQLADDIRIFVDTNDIGQIVAVQIKGQPEIGKEALAHESEVVQLMQTVDPLVSQPFTVRVHTDGIPVWQLSRHTGGKRVQIVGRFCLGDLIYTPQP